MFMMLKKQGFDTGSFNIADTYELGPKGCTRYNGLYGEAAPERGTFFSLQVYERVMISQFEVYKTVGKSVVSQRELNK